MRALLILNSSDLRQRSMAWLLNERRGIEQALRDVVDDFTSNPMLWYESRTETLYSLMLQELSDERYELTLWSMGDIAIYNTTFIGRLERPMDICILDRMEFLVREWEKGYVMCDECHRFIKLGEVAGRWHASVYCKSCWEGSYKKKRKKSGYV